VFYPAVSVALGNIVLADHGQTVADHGQTVGDKSFTFRGRPGKPVLPRQRPRLRQGPVSQRIPYMHPTSAPFPSAVATLRQAPVDALPDAWLQTDQASGAPHWEPKRDLLGSDDTVLAWVGEVDDDGIMAIRFGDDQHGRRPALGTGFYATYRVGNGAAGNVGYEAIAHIISTDPSVKGATNPLPAQGGADPESISDVRQRASSAFRTQQRAVTAQDYADRAATLEDSEGLAEVQRAAASFRWTGSWHTVFTTVDRVGGKRVEEGDFEKRMRDWLDLYRMAGHDVEIENPRLVSLEIAMQVCVKPDYFKSPVEQELKRVFGTGLLPDGRRAVFHPDNFTFGQTLYLSSLYAAAQAVAGVASVKITKFQRQGIDSNEAIDSGKLVLGRLEVARLENSPNFPERGHFDLVVEGGK
jgi:predicted phage baseplate assembly protein